MLMVFPLKRFPNILHVRQVGYVLASYVLAEDAETYLTPREFSLLSDFCSSNYKILVNDVISEEILAPVYMLNRISNLFFSVRFSSVTFDDLIVRDGIIQYIKPKPLFRLNYAVSPIEFNAATKQSVTEYSYIVPVDFCNLQRERFNVLKGFCNSYDLDYKKIQSAVYRAYTPKLFYTYSLYKGDVLMKFDFNLLTNFAQLKALAMSTDSYFDAQYQDSLLKLILVPNFSDNSCDYDLKHGDKVYRYGMGYTYRNMPVPLIHSCGKWSVKPCSIGAYRDKVYSYSMFKDEYIAEVLSEYNFNPHNIHSRNYVPEIKYNFGSNRSWKSKKIKKQWQKHKQKPIKKQTKGTHYYFTATDVTAFDVPRKKIKGLAEPPLSEEELIEQLSQQYPVDYWLDIFNAG